MPWRLNRLIVQQLQVTLIIEIFPESLPIDRLWPFSFYALLLEVIDPVLLLEVVGTPMASMHKHTHAHAA